MSRFFHETISVPIWFALLMMLCMVGWQFATTAQTRNLKELFRLYWRAEHGSEWDDAASIDENRAAHFSKKK